MCYVMWNELESVLTLGELLPDKIIPCELGTRTHRHRHHHHPGELILLVVFYKYVYFISIQVFKDLILEQSCVLPLVLETFEHYDG